MKSNIISKQNILDSLFKKQRLGIKPGLERTIALCSFAGNPQNKFRTVHVAGTNGKGSVCSSIAAVMMSAGYVTGLYTSPHLIDFNERIRINDTLIPDDKIIEYYLFLEEEAEKVNATFFEITTVMAFMYFAEKNVDIAIIETGMGGRYDSTNVITPLLSVITKIDYDHKEYLGDTIEQISFEKAGIIKQNIPCIISKNSELVYESIKQFSPKSSKLIFGDNEVGLINKGFSEDFSSKWKVFFRNIELDFYYDIAGLNQKDNIKSIILSLILLREYFSISDESIIYGLDNIKYLTGLKARIQILSKKPLIILDGAHNENSIENLFETLNFQNNERKWNLIINIMSDKSINNVIPYLKNYSASVNIPKLKTERATNCSKLRDYFHSFGIEDINIYDSVCDAIQTKQNSNNVLIFGSFYLAGEVLEYFEKC